MRSLVPSPVPSLRKLAASAALAAAVVAASPVLAHDPAEPEHGGDAACSATCGELCQQALDAARQATAPYVREKRALDEGFVPDAFCIASPLGTMGFHYPNTTRMDTSIDATKPDILIYVQRPNGTRKLVALEYFTPVLSHGAPWRGGANEPPPVIDNPAPVLFGQRFDGPMPGHNPSMPWHYDLHVWLWEHNPAGTFAQFNPKLSCPK